jgi:type IV secretion system protein VirB8
MSNIVRYVNARETYLGNAAAIKKQYQYVILNSSGLAQKEYIKFFDDLDNPDNPITKYGFKTTVSLEIKNISFLNKTTASVRFLTRSSSAGKEETHHYISILAFRYITKPTSLKDRFINPLGFQVLNYRRDQEIITP